MAPNPWRGTRALATSICAAVLVLTPLWLANVLSQSTSVAAASHHDVQIVACSPYCFAPMTVSGSPGDGVTWTNNTTAPHNITRCDTSACGGQGPGTGADSIGSSTVAPAGGAYGHTFSSGGTYFYYCSIHGYNVMHGEIDVSGGPTPAPPPTPRPTPRLTPRPVPPPTATVRAPARAPLPTASPAPTPAPTPMPPSAVAAVLPTLPSTPSPAPTGAAALSAAGTGAIAGGAGPPLAPILIALLVIAALGAAGYLVRRRRSPA